MIRLYVNNGDIIQILQKYTDGDISVMRRDHGCTKVDYSYTISAGDMVMLLNLYRYVKENDIQDDFINPNGKNREKRK